MRSGAARAMNSEILATLMAAVQRQETVGLVTLTAVEGDSQARIGDQCLVWLRSDRANAGRLRLGPEETARVRELLRKRRHDSLRVARGSSEWQLFVEVHRRPPHLLIAGAGHIAVPLAQIGTLCDFAVTVLDDRPQYANAARFPMADQVLAADFLPALRGLRDDGRLDTQTFVVLVTRGHQYDVECLAELLDDDLAYVGMIGSKRRIRAVFELLQSQRGVPRARLDRVYAPIGLNLGAQTPAEIAVAIMAEIITLRQQGPLPSFRDELQR